MPVLAIGRETYVWIQQASLLNNEHMKNMVSEQEEQMILGH